MGLEAIDLIAPPMRTSEAGASAAEDDGQPSFADHLERTEAPKEKERAPERRPAPEQRAEEPVRAETPPPPEQPEEAAVVTAAPQPQQTQAPKPQAHQAPLLAQIFASLTAQNGAKSAPTPTIAADGAPGEGEENPNAQQTPTAPIVVTLPAQAKAQPKTTAPKAAPVGKTKGEAEATTTTQTQTAQPTTTPTLEATAQQNAMTPEQVAAQPTQDTQASPDTPQFVLASAPATPETPTPQPRGPGINVDHAAKAAAPDLKPAADADAGAVKPPAAKTAAPHAAAKADAPASVPSTDTGAPASSPTAAQAAASQSAQSNAPASEKAAAALPPAPAQVGREIIRRFQGGSTRFDLRLDPAELGRVDVRIEVSRDHKVTAVISADNPQALSDLSRGARDLQQALQSAGLDLADDGLSFDLSNHQNNFAQADQSEDGRRSAAQGGRGSNGNAPVVEPQAAPARPLGLERWRGTRIDVMA